MVDADNENVDDDNNDAADDDVAKIRLLENCPGWGRKVSVTSVNNGVAVVVVVVIVVVVVVIVVVVVGEVGILEQK